MKRTFSLINKYRRTIIFGLFLILLFVVTPLVFSRAGGGGSFSGGGSSDDGLFSLLIQLIFFVIFHVPFPFNLIIIGALIAVFFLFKKKTDEKTVYNNLPKVLTPAVSINNIKGYPKFIAANPDFDQQQFKKKVRTAFTQIQEAWEKQDLSKVRKFISDGVYQRFNTQFKMMKILEQEDKITELQIKSIIIDKIDTDGMFDIIHTAIRARLTDNFVSKKYPFLNTGGTEEFIEYWSFIKKRGVKAKDMYHSQNCPKCGAALPEKMGEVSKCQFCQTITNLGEYDWVLSEITQADDYITTHPKLAKPGLKENIKNLISAQDDFSVQAIEDKASNGYLQILTALTCKEPAIMRRFVSDRAFDKIKASMRKEKVVYNRLYLNDVTLIGVAESENQNILTISVKSSFQRVILDEKDDKKARYLDHAVISETEILFMTRDKSAGLSKGSLYSHSCPSCGGPLNDTLDTTCPFCDAALNSPASEWIITDIMDKYQYNQYLSTNKSDFSYQVKPDLIDSLYNVRDFAFNNALIMIAADGVFDPGEEEFARKLAKKWGYNVNKIHHMFEMAKSGRLVIRMPDNMKQRKKIYKLMHRAAMADGNICDSEQKLLNFVERNYL